MSTVLVRHNLAPSDRLGHFSDQWTGHTQARDAGNFTDLVLVPEAGEVGVHTAVLLPLSPFLSHLAGAMQGPQLIVLLPGVELVTVRQMVDLVYTGRCNISSLFQVEEVMGLMAGLGLVISRDKLEVGKRQVHIISGINIKATEDVIMKLQPCDEIEKLEPSDEIEQCQMGSINDAILIQSQDNSSSNTDLKITESSNNIVTKEGCSHTCPHCARVFRFSRNLSMHMQSHSSERPISCPCCSQTFKKSHHLKRHITFRHRVQSTREELGKGKTGGSGSKTSRAVKALSFENIKTAEAEKFACPLCGIQTYSSGRLSLHMMTSHKKSQEVQEGQVNVRKRGPGRPRKLTFDTPSVTSVNEKPIIGKFSGGMGEGVKKEPPLEGDYILVGSDEETEGYFMEVQYSSEKQAPFNRVGQKRFEQWSTTATIPADQKSSKETEAILPDYLEK